MLPSKAIYGLRALMFLGERYEGSPALISEIAEKEEIPKKFLEAILLELKNKGYLRAKKGKGGGYWLIKNPKDVFIGDIIRILSGPLAPTSCSSKTAFAPCPECPDVETCKIRLLMEDVRQGIAEILDNESLQNLLERK
ncbi:MAG: Rrf2 family transcriptional regulator [Melioribacteraceae bacterium]|nr:Rrf2 family transcriptional regulator [Melioribacteraceae bacterium]